MKVWKTFVVAFALSCLVSANSFADNDDRRDIVTTAASNGSFNTLVSLLVATGLDDALSGKGEFTVFAPNDDAFAKLPASTLQELRQPENAEKLASILKYHVVGRALSVPKNAPSHPLKSIATLLGPEIQFDRNGTTLRVNQSKVIARNIRCTNGNIQVIDNVLLPPKSNTIVDIASEAGNFGTLLAAAKAAGLAEALAGKGPLTVFAPTDEAFKKLPKGTVINLLKPENRSQLAAILKYHVVAGNVSAADAIKAANAKTLEGRSLNFTIRDGQLNVNESGVTANDIEASNGTIHIIDAVLLPAPEKKVTIRSDWRTKINRDGVEAEELLLFCTGGGAINLTNVKAKKIVTRISGGGSVTIDGVTQSHVAQVNGGAKLAARDLQTQSTRVNVNGGGDATVNAMEKLKVSAASGANVRYVKTDAEIDKSINRMATFTSIH